MGLAAHSPRLHSYLQRLVSSRCKPHAPAPRKQPGSSRWLHQEDRLAKCYYQSQMSRSFPSHLLNLSSFPLMLALSLSIVCTFITLCPSRSKSVFVTNTLTFSRSSLFLTRPIPLSLLRFSQTPSGCPEAHLSGSHATVISHNITQRTSGAAQKASVWRRPSKESRCKKWNPSQIKLHFL